MIIAPNRADMTETMINVKAHPSSPAASENYKKNYYLIKINVMPSYFTPNWFYANIRVNGVIKCKKKPVEWILNI